MGCRLAPGLTHVGQRSYFPHLRCALAIAPASQILRPHLWHRKLGVDSY